MPRVSDFGRVRWVGRVLDPPIPPGDWVCVLGFNGAHTWGGPEVHRDTARASCGEGGELGGLRRGFYPQGGSRGRTRGSVPLLLVLTPPWPPLSHSGLPAGIFPPSKRGNASLPSLAR